MTVDKRERTVELEEASTHKSAKTHAGNVFETCNLDLLTPKINGFPGLLVEHFYVKFGASVFEISCGKQHRQTAGKTLPPRLPSAWVNMRMLVMNYGLLRSGVPLTVTTSNSYC